MEMNKDKAHHEHEKHLVQNRDCVCNDECISCEAEKLAAVCGCTNDSKHYEYNLNKKLSHVAHEKLSHDNQNFTRLSHQDHEAAMSNPQMAKKMEQDMAKRFWISLIFTIPVLLYSPLAVNIFNLRLPSFIPANWLMFILTTPVVFWTGSIFIVGAYNSLKSKKLNMSVLISTGVLAAYIFSVVITLFIGGETFFE
ncbi:MAG: hypothetical protein ACYCXK_04745, partial [Candidatus Humimicrobiaceae bacterium]